MAMKKYIVDVIVAYIVFAVLWTVYAMALMEPQMAAMGDLMHPQDHPNQMVVLVWHFIQTLVMVWFWHKGLGSDQVKDGLIFGLMYGLLIGASDMVWYYGMAIPQDPKSLMFIGHLVISGIVGGGLAKLYPKPAGDETA